MEPDGPAPEVRLPEAKPLKPRDLETSRLESKTLDERHLEAERDQAQRGQAGQSDDRELLKRAAAGDGAAFHSLLDRHMSRLYRLAVSLVGNAADAEDLLQETFAGAYRGLDRFEGRASVGTWLTRILVMQIARFRRDRRRKATSSIQGVFGSAADSSAPSPGAEVRSTAKPSESGVVDVRIDMQAALLKLSSAHREVLVLREFEQMSYEEIADVLGVPQGTVESRLYRARAELRERLSDYLP